MEIKAPMTDEQRTKLIEAIAERYLDNLSLRDLERFFYDAQVDWLSDYSDEELEGAAEDVGIETDEVQEILA